MSQVQRVAEAAVVARMLKQPLMKIVRILQTEVREAPLLIVRRRKIHKRMNAWTERECKFASVCVRVHEPVVWLVCVCVGVSMRARARVRVHVRVRARVRVRACVCAWLACKRDNMSKSCELRVVR